MWKKLCIIGEVVIGIVVFIILSCWLIYHFGVLEYNGRVLGRSGVYYIVVDSEKIIYEVLDIKYNGDEKVGYEVYNGVVGKEDVSFEYYNSELGGIINKYNGYKVYTRNGVFKELDNNEWWGNVIGALVSGYLLYIYISNRLLVLRKRCNDWILGKGADSNFK